MKKEENILKRIFTDYIKYHWKMRIAYFSFLAVLTAIFMALEPLFLQKQSRYLKRLWKEIFNFDLKLLGGFLLGG